MRPRAWIRNDAARDEPMPNKEYEDGADSCGDETGSLVGATAQLLIDPGIVQHAVRAQYDGETV